MGTKWRLTMKQACVLPEIAREGRVDEGVDGRVAVSQPEDDREEEWRHAVLAEGRDQVHGEEGEPAADEAAHDDPQRLGRLRLHTEPTHLK